MPKQKRSGVAGARRDYAGQRPRVSNGKPVQTTKQQTTRNQFAGGANARQRYQHYLALAEAAEKSGDRVSSESYYQHADHYYRVLHNSGAGEAAGA